MTEEYELWWLWHALYSSTTAFKVTQRKCCLDHNWSPGMPLLHCQTQLAMLVSDATSDFGLDLV